MALILGAAPRLGDMLARQPQIMDGLIDPRFFGAMPDQKELSARLAATLKDADSYEDFLDRLRLFGQESLFLIGTRILSGTVSAQQASVAFADVAEGIVHTVHGLVRDQFAAQYGRIKGQETAILAMGRLGSREMTASSDLDLILLYDFDDDSPDSDGERSLHGAQYFARLTQRLISAFTTRTNYGVLYDVDMRLRPSGRAGPVASRIDSFADYQEREAWTWEHMALTRARVISASPAFRDKIEDIIRGVLTRPRDRAATASDVADMRRAIALEKGEDDIWDLKLPPAGSSISISSRSICSSFTPRKNPKSSASPRCRCSTTPRGSACCRNRDAEILRSAARLYHDLTQIIRLCVTDKFNPETSGENLLRVMARAGDTPDFSTLEARVRETAGRGAAGVSGRWCVRGYRGSDPAGWIPTLRSRLRALQRPRRVALEQDRAGRPSDGRAAFRLQRDLEQLILHGFRQRLQIQLQRARLTGEADRFRANGAIPQRPDLQRAAGRNLDRA